MECYPHIHSRRGFEEDSWLRYAGQAAGRSIFLRLFLCYNGSLQEGESAMIGRITMRNGVVSGLEGVSFSLDDPDVFYGYGCYEVLKLRGGRVYFPEFHADRLIESIRILGIEHSFTKEDVVHAISELVMNNGLSDCNIKILVIGHETRAADWYVFATPALYPPENAPEKGVSCLLYHGERQYPRVKSLSLLLSTKAYRTARSFDCYDALLINAHGQITEGSRTNVFFCDSGSTDLSSPVIYTPPEHQVLSGITRMTVLEALREAGWKCRERELELSAVLDGSVSLMISSTSTRLVPVGSVIDRGIENSDTPGLVKIPRSAILDNAAALYASWLATH